MEDATEYLETDLTDGIPVEQAEFPLCLTNDIEPMPYAKIKGLITNEGQRKLFISHLYFLIQVFIAWMKTDKTKKVQIVYAGAAPGCSLPLIDKIVDGAKWIAKWIVYDVVGFDSELKRSSRFECHSEYFTDEIAQSYAGWQDTFLVFMDDIRLSPNMNRKEPNYSAVADELIWKDLNLGNNWLITMLPWMWWRKFRMPYNSVTDELGNIINSMQCIPGIEDVFQAWIGAGSTEIRRWGTLAEISHFCENPKSEEFRVDFKDYEGQLQRYNAEMREKNYLHNVRFKGLCFCHDCNFEIWVWQEFLKEFRNKEATTLDIIQNIQWLDDNMPAESRLFNPATGSQHGKYPYLSMEERWQKLQPDQEKYQKHKDRKNEQRAGKTAQRKPCEKCKKMFAPKQPQHKFCISCIRNKA